MNNSGLPPIYLIKARPLNCSLRSILIADDDAEQRELLCAALKGAGYNTDEAATGAEALEKVVAKNFHVVLLDMIMPEDPRIFPEGNIGRRAAFSFKLPSQAGGSRC